MENIKEEISGISPKQAGLFCFLMEIDEKRLLGESEIILKYERLSLTTNKASATFERGKAPLSFLSNNYNGQFEIHDNYLTLARADKGWSSLMVFEIVSQK